MKKITIFLFLAAFSLYFCSCEKYLTHDDPSGVTDADWWETEANARNALNAVYAGMPQGTDGRNIMLAGSDLSDEAVGRQSSFGDYEQFTKSLQTSDWGVALHIWRDNFLDIRRANRFLENVGNVYMDEALKARYKAEARALRAYYHLELFLLYGAIPIADHSLSQNENTLTRNTEEECYTFIFTELAAAAEELPVSYSTSEAWRISKPACWAFITRLALFYKHFDVAAEYAKKVIDLDVFVLYPDYAKLFTYDGELNQERIYYKDAGCATAWDRFAPNSLGGRTAVSPTNIVVNNFETRQGKTIWELGADSVALYKRNPNYHNNRDPRLSASVLLPDETYLGEKLQPFLQDNANMNRVGVQASTMTGYWVKKYLDTKDQNGARSLDFMYVRYAEILLTYVESLIEIGKYDHDDVTKYIDQVRQRAGMPKVDKSKYNSQETLRTLVRRERQAELAFEGQRFFDIRRWGIASEVMNGQVYGATNPETGETVKVEVRTYKPDRDIRYPIPRGEITANPNLAQNPGY
ncbi:RagB/SusD family nutrient uptake outer membrane protein [Olivibacter ginsenosidimutans]|uniref:RagB/SusD family nutrient uptake outer membrane protein n=1 Tax=Olivibacter ginsenosidimutans TaxID=1176537 RepID=A0ABP9C872_9SPHI